MVKKKLVEIKASRLARAKQKPTFNSKSHRAMIHPVMIDGEDFSVDWRAQHL
jgi:hypothetical protein